MNVNENALIQVQDLKKSFGTQVVLDGITTEIDQGEVVAIIGHPVVENLPFYAP